MGLSVPLGGWLRGALREWADDLLSPAHLEREGLLTAEPVQQAWRRVLAGRDEGALGVWAVLMFAAWKERWLR
jgi:asparagine synthase (glutamine-hydrolysing)